MFRVIDRGVGHKLFSPDCSPETLQPTTVSVGFESAFELNDHKLLLLFQFPVECVVSTMFEFVIFIYFLICCLFLGFY